MTCSRPGRRTMVAAVPPSQRPALPPVPSDDLPEPPAAVTEAADETEMPLPSDPRTFFLGGLFALGVLAALYVASSVILPSPQQVALADRQTAPAAKRDVVM